MDNRLFYISELIQKKIQGIISSDEDLKLTEWINSSAAAKQLFEQLSSDSFDHVTLSRFDHYNIDKNKAKILHKWRAYKNKLIGDVYGQKIDNPMLISDSSSYKPTVNFRKVFALAASVIGLVILSTYLLTLNKNNNTPPNKIVALTSNDIKAPVINKAQIKLADGSLVYLEAIKNGTKVRQPNMEIIKTDDGKIEYKILANNPKVLSSAEMMYNTLSNPRGSKVINLRLVDGSQVWLNAGSTISYPIAFNGNERRVNIQGEAYFEVAKNKLRPFIVTARGTEVKVLGTHFNVNAYHDESIVKTTLLEGAVQITKKTVKVTLAPGEQANINENGKVNVDKNVNTDGVMAWKNGAFYFDGLDINTVMRQVARWYDVNVVFEGKIPDGHYRGKPSRDLTLTQMLKVIEYSGVKFKVEGKKVIIIE